MLSVMGVIIAETSWAITAPTQGSAFYDFYNIAINQIQKGPIGFVGGWIAIIMGAASIIMGKYVMGLASVLGGAAILKADSLVASLGAIF